MCRRAISLGAPRLLGQHLDAGRDVVMAQYFGRLGYIVLLEDLRASTTQRSSR